MDPFTLKKAKEEEFEKGRKEGIKEGRKQEKLQIALALLGQLLSSE